MTEDKKSEFLKRMESLKAKIENNPDTPDMKRAVAEFISLLEELKREIEVDLRRAKFEVIQ